MYKPIPKRKIKDPNSRLTSDDIDGCSNKEQLIEWKTHLEMHMVDADLQINIAKGKAASKSEYMDPEKYGKLLSYRRVLGFLHQRIILRERLFNHQSKVDDTLPLIFMQCAKSTLPTETYELIYGKAKELSGL